ncbi:MAG: GIY-YIG nuclease family protein [Bacteroidia bacterium]|nr:GIY-YIG nuclease family protein [Bacteroidia bacterium]
MICCYILYSEKLQCHYIGACQQDLESRIKKHNAHEYGENRFTAKAEDWRLVLAIECETYSQALKIEKHIKRMKSSVYIFNLIKYPEMQLKLKLKYT